MHTDADHGAFFSDAQPSKFKIGLMHSAFAAYDIPAAHLTARGVYTNKAPGGVAYRCWFRVTEAMFFQERMVQAAADDLGMDQAAFRRMNFVRDDDFPHRTPFGFLTDSGQYAKCLDVGLKAIDYENFRKEQAAARQRGRLLGLGISTMTEPLGAGNSREYDILGIKMFDSADLKVHMTGKAILRTGAKTQGQGHETTWAQIVAHELGIPADDVVVEEGDTDTAPFGMGTYASRSTPVAGAAVAMVSRKIRAKARKLAAHLLEVSEEDVEWELGRFYVRSSPSRGVTIQECAMAAYSNMPDGMEPGLENTAYYDPPNLTWPFAVYIVTVEVDPETGVWDVLRMVAVDDCGVRINPMIVEGQIMGGLTEAYAMSSMQFITFDADGNCVGSNYMDYLLPTAWETPGYELHSEVVTPCPHHPIGAKGIGECAAVGGPAAFVNAVIDALDGQGCGTSTCRFCRTGCGKRSHTGETCPARRQCARTGTEPGRYGHERFGSARAGRRAGPQRADVRARDGGLAPGTVVGQAGLARDHHRGRAGARLDRRCLRGAGGDPRGEAGHGGRERPAAAARHPGPVRRGRPGGNDRGADLLPERGRPRDLYRAGVPRAAPGDRGQLAHVTDARRAGQGARLVRDLVSGTEFTPGHAAERSMVVVATQGHGDEDMMEHAIAAHPAYLGLVASHRRAEAVLGYLADRGVPQEQLDKVHAPAGLDLGRTSHEEIAVAVLAELVQLRASGAFADLPAQGKNEARTELKFAEAVEALEPGLRDDRHGGCVRTAPHPRRGHLLLLLCRLPPDIRGES